MGKLNLLVKGLRGPLGAEQMMELFESMGMQMAMEEVPLQIDEVRASLQGLAEKALADNGKMVRMRIRAGDGKEIFAILVTPP